MFYLTKMPWIVKKFIYPRYIWSLPVVGKNIYLTFDDGPHPTVTPFVLDLLKEYHAKATFFCIGKNVLDNAGVYRRILNEGHSVGNHTHNHLDGWKVDDGKYLHNIITASKHIDSTLFRPPYGRITKFQSKQVMEELGFNIIMWSVLTGDFDINLSPEDCWKNTLKAIVPGSVIVFHDSEKAKDRMMYVLPKLLKHFIDEGFSFERITLQKRE